MKEGSKSNDSSLIIAQALEEMKAELGGKYSLEKINLAVLERRTGLSRARLRRLVLHFRLLNLLMFFLLSAKTAPHAALQYI